ncbi:hypothetical protein [Metapseudomonas otitidis]|uniref:Uncharacterized protein n=1 Tax=Metapseudomonas otitidis TaxID=319939 RepID=A0A679GJZ8_9GAMM|nr:hypothetical protein PtoMrB4_37090 [Pseudomonas otitidis]
MARELGFTCEAAQIPQRDRKVDWNDSHQRRAFIERGLREARYHGSLLLAESAAEKGALMYEWRERHEFHFAFENLLYWFKMDLEKFNKSMRHLEESERQEDQLLNDRQRCDKALRQCGAVVEIANCCPQALYFQRNEVTDESWYYFRVDFLHDEPTVCNTFTGGQVAAASEFKKRLLGMAAGAVFAGTGAQVDRIMRDQLYGLKTVKTIDYIGYSKEHSCYVFGDLAVRGGVLEQANAEGYFEFKQLRLKRCRSRSAWKSPVPIRAAAPSASTDCGPVSAHRASSRWRSGSARCSPSRSVTSTRASLPGRDGRGRRG